MSLVLASKFSNKPVKFAMVGCIGFVVDLSSLFLFYDLLGIDLIPARMLAFILAVTTTWYGNRRYTFSEFNLVENRLHEWSRFFCSSVMSAVPNIGTFFILSLILPTTHTWILFGMIAGILVGYYSNYKFATGWVFKASDQQ